MKFIILIVTILLFITSCKLILGVHDPQNLNSIELNDYFIKNNFDTINCLAFRKTALDSISKVPYKKGWPPGLRSLQYKAFLPNGKMVSQYVSCEGGLKKLELLDYFPPKNRFEIDTTYLFYEDISMYALYDGSSPNQKVENYDLTIVVYWAKWMGLPSKKLIKNINDYKARFSNKKIQIIYVNVGELVI